MMLWSHGVIAASDAPANVPKIDAAPKVFCKEEERSGFNWPCLKSAAMHLLIVYSTYFTTAPSCAADTPALARAKIPQKKILTPTCAENLGVHVCCAQAGGSKAL